MRYEKTSGLSTVPLAAFTDLLGWSGPEDAVGHTVKLQEKGTSRG